MPDAASRSPDARLELAARLRSRRTAVVGEWTRGVRPLLERKGIDAPALVDHIPDVVSGLADALDAAGDRPPESWTRPAESHALARLDDGFDLEEVVSEYMVLRECVFRECMHAGEAVPLDVADALNRTLDEAMLAAVRRYTEARNRTLRAIDRVVAVSLESRSLDELLHKLLNVFIDTTAAVDTAAILLRDGDELHVRATIGLEAERDRAMRFPVGKGFSGTIAATGKPRSLRFAAKHPEVLSDIVREKGLRALFGVPLTSDGEVIGVAHMGSITACEFSDEDKHLFTTMTERATAAIELHRARDEADSARLRLEQVIEATVDGIIVADGSGTVVLANEAAARLFGVGRYELLCPIAEYPGRFSLKTIDGVPTGPVAMRALLGETVVGAERTIVQPTGDVRHLRVGAAPLYGPDRSVTGAVVTLADITEKWLAEQTVANQRAWLEEVLDRMPLALLLVEPRTARIIFVNEAADAMGTIPDAGPPSPGYALLSPDGAPIPATESPRQRAARGEKLTGVELVWRTPEREVALLVHSDMLPAMWGHDATVILAVQDITQLKRAERARRFVHDVSALLASSLDYELTLDRVVASLVPPIADRCAIDLAEPDGTVRRVAVAPGASAPSKDGVRGARSDAETDAVRKVVATGKAIVRSRRAVMPLVAAGRLLGTLTLVKEHAPGYYGPEEIALLEELASWAAVAIDNARLYRTAREAIGLRDDVLAIVSHDLRNPLGAILASAATLLRRANADEHLAPARRSADVILRSATRMDRLLRDLVDAATIAAGGLSIAVAPVDPAELVRTAVDLAEPLAREKGIALSAEIRDALPGVACDRDRVLQVLSNLLGNAIQMTPEGGAVVARAERGEGDVRFAVSDTGPGIEPADLPRVFERYWRGQHARHGGRGLGLAIAKGIIDAHRGRIGAESTVGAGSTFWFALPPCEKAS